MPPVWRKNYSHLNYNHSFPTHVERCYLMGTNYSGENRHLDGGRFNNKGLEPGQAKPSRHEWTTGRVFPAARGDGTCDRCHLPIEKGQLIRVHYDLGVIHARHQHREPPEQPTCQTCWLQHTPGECDR